LEYDPTRRGVDRNGKLMIAHLVAAEDPLLAKEFPTIMDAEECWKQAFGLPKDGRPNRPLTREENPQPPFMKTAGGDPRLR
jgi:hypothetical protein